MSDMQEVVNDWPPNIEAIRVALPVTERNIFAYDHKIYKPGPGVLGPELIAHEKVHFAQQDEIGVAIWWILFIQDPSFRLHEEMPAHRREYRVFCKHNRDRNRQRWFLRLLGKRLAAPMYGGIIGVKEAMRQIEA